MNRMRTLGTVELHGADGGELRALAAQPRRVALLVHLVLATPRGPLKRDSLLALFWPDHDLEHARNSLSQAVHVLRRWLGPEAIVSHGADALSVDAAHVWCDAIAFEAALDAGRPADALALYRGPLLEGFHVSGAPEFGRWMEDERARLAARHAAALEAVAAGREAAGDMAGAVAHWRRLASGDPYSSRVALRLMRALAASGDPGAAVQHARVHERLLRDELEVAPDPEIAAFVRQLQARSDEAAAPSAIAAPDGGASAPAAPAAPAPVVIAAPSRAWQPAPSRWTTMRGVLTALLLVALAGPRISSSEADAAVARPVARRAHDLWARGQEAERDRSLGGLQAARDLYRASIATDSTYAPAWAGLAAVYGFLGDYSFAPVLPMLDSARMMAQHAMALDSMIPESRVALAVSLGDHGQFAAAEHQFRRALELDPGNARAHYWYSVLLVALGRGEEALREARRAEQLDPAPPRGVKAMQRYATFLATGKRIEKTMTYDERRPILRTDPNEPWARARAAYDFAEDGRCEDALPAAAWARRLVQPDNFRTRSVVGPVYVWCGDTAHGRALLDSMKRHPWAHEQGYRIALMHVAFGERDSAFTWLERQRWPMAELTALRADRMLDSLRGDPRFPALLRRLQLLR